MVFTGTETLVTMTDKRVNLSLYIHPFGDLQWALFGRTRLSNFDMYEELWQYA